MRFFVEKQWFFVTPMLNKDRKAYDSRALESSAFFLPNLLNGNVFSSKYLESNIIAKKSFLFVNNSFLFVNNNV